MAIDGSIIAIDRKANTRLYGRKAPADDIIAGTVSTEIEAAKRFQRAILASTGSSSPGAAPSLATSTPTETEPVTTPGASENTASQGAVTYPLEDSHPGAEPPQ